MSTPGRLRRRIPVALAAATAATLAVGLPAASSSAATRPVPHGPTIDIQLLSFNDFHGNLEPPSGSSGRITTSYVETPVLDPVTKQPVQPPRYQASPVTQDAGGVEYLATHLRQARVGHPNTVTVAAGDIIGASPLLSAAFHDEPTIEAMNQLGLQATAVGNHEFDEGYQELLRMQNGGCLPDGPNGLNNQNSCPDHTFAGAKFQFLAANVKYAGTDKTILPPYWVDNINGARIGFIGMTLKETPTIVTKSGVQGLEFTDEVATANALVPVLRAQGVKAIVVLVHQGGVPAKTTFTGAQTGHVYTVDSPYDYTCQGGGKLTDDSAILPIAENLDPEIDMIISGHTHQPYVCNIPDNKTHQNRLVTSASSFGRLFTETNLTYDRRTQDIVRSSVQGSNVIVTRNVPKADDMTSLIEEYNTLVAPIKNKVIGKIDGTVLSRTKNAAGESPLGDLIADAQANDPSVVAGGKTPQVAFMNPGGIRADLQAQPDGSVLYGDAFTVQPFNNYVVSMDMTGAQLYALLQQQWSGLNAGSNIKMLEVNKDFRYTWTANASGARSVVPGSVYVGATQVANDSSQTFRVVANSFLSDGGDNFAAFASATDKVIGGLDIDAFANYLSAHSPYTAPALTRITTTP